MLNPPELADILYAAVWSGLPLGSSLVVGVLRDTTEALMDRGTHILIIFITHHSSLMMAHNVTHDCSSRHSLQG